MLIELYSRNRFEPAVPPDVRRRLCLAGSLELDDGLWPWYGLWPVNAGPSPNEGQSPSYFLQSNGKA